MTKFAVVTFCPPETEPVWRLSLPNLRGYCDRHGYELVIAKAPPARAEASGRACTRPSDVKFDVLLQHLDSFDWLLWVDPDTLVKDPAVPLSKLLDPDADLILGSPAHATRGGGPVDASAVDTSDVRTEAFLVSNRSGRARPFLEAVTARQREGTVSGADARDGEAFAHLLGLRRPPVRVRFAERRLLGTAPPDHRRGDFLLCLRGHPGRVYLLRKHLDQLPHGGPGAAPAAVSGPAGAPDLETGRELAEAAAQCDAGRSDLAEAACRRALARRPEHPTALHLLGLTAAAAGRFDEALDLLCRAVESDPAVADAHGNLGAVLGRLGLHEDAVRPLQQAARLAPLRPETWENLGVALGKADRHRQAAEAHRRSIRLAPLRPEGHYHLGAAVRKLNRAEEALPCLRRATELRPDYFEAHHEISCAAGDCGRLDELLAALGRAIELRPGAAGLHSALLFCLLHRDGADPDTTLAQHLEWERRHAQSLYPADPPRFRNDKSAGRRLRVGYVSPDYRQHPVAVFLEPLLAHHDRGAFEVYGYSDVRTPDVITRRIRGLCDVWRDIVDAPDERVMELVRRDRIDILVDLAGHTGDNRLLLFARRAAPVQVSYLGYPHTTAIRTIDYRLTDDHHDPPGTNQRYYTERLVRLGRSAWCYQPADGCDAVATVPAERAGRVTFGSANRLMKLTPEVIALWSEVLRATPGSRMLVLAGGGNNGRDYVLGQFGLNGIDPGRVEVAPRQRTHLDYLSLYHQMDVLLDAFPYVGETTTFDAAWMGVPAVTLAGRATVTRPGVNVLANVGLHDLIVENADEYVRAATTLAHDLDRLRELRHTLRQRMAGSALCDGAGLARRIEEAYRRMWSEWCSAAPASDQDFQDVLSSQVRPALPPAPDNLPATSPAGP